MEATLKWEEQKCVNPPPAPADEPAGTVWRLCTICGPGWVYFAELVQPDEAFHEWIPQRLNKENYPTERAAQLACEAALWRLEIIPLPPWEDAVLRVGDWRALVFATPDTEWYWGVRPNGSANNVVEGYADTKEQACDMAGAHLRVQIAMALDGECEKEKREWTSASTSTAQ